MKEGTNGEPQSTKTAVKVLRKEHRSRRCWPTCICVASCWDGSSKAGNKSYGPTLSTMPMTVCHEHRGPKGPQLGATAQPMREGPSEPAYRSRFQTAFGGCEQKSWS